MKTLLIILLTLNSTVFAADLTVYTSLNASYLKPIFEEYSSKNGVGVSFVIADPVALQNRLSTEKEKSPADILLIKGVKYLSDAQAKGLFSAVDSDTLNNNIPDHLKSSYWYGLSKRARTIVYHSKKVDVDDLSTYQALADPKWKGKLCLLTPQKEYTLSFVTALLIRLGEQETTRMLTGWMDNLAMPLLSEDMQITEAIETGQCDVGIINSYYMARVKQNNPKTQLKLFWPDQDSDGVHVNVMAAGVTKHAPNRDQAIDFIEWMSTKQMQVKFSRVSMEYPVNKRVYPPRAIAKWGRFKEDHQPLANLERHFSDAIIVLNKSGYQ